MDRDEMERELRDLLQAAFGEPPHQVTVAAVRRRLIRRRAMEAVAGAAAVAAVISVAVPALGGIFGSHGRGASLAHRAIAYVVNEESGTVTPIRIATNTALPPVKAGRAPNAIAITPDGKTVYVANNNSDTVTPIRTATNTALPPVKTGHSPTAIAITPDGKTAYVANSGLATNPSAPSTVTPIRTGTNTALPSVKVGRFPQAIAVTPDGKTAYVVNLNSDTVTPIRTATNTALPPVKTGHSPTAIAITPDGKTAYVVNNASDTVTPIRTATNTALPPVKVGRFPQAIAVTPDGRTAYVANNGSDTVTPIQTATNTALPPVKTGRDPGAIAITPDGKTAYVTNFASDTVTPIRTATNTALRRIKTGSEPADIAITPDGKTAYVANNGSDTVTPIRTATNTALPPVKTGRQPVAIAITPGAALVTPVATRATAVKSAAATASSPWSQTDYNAAQSRANLTEQTLTAATVGHARYLRSLAAPPAPIGGFCGFNRPDQGIVAPLLTGGDLYAVTNGRLTKYDTATGAIIWRHNPDRTFSRFYESLAVAGGLVVVGEISCDSVSQPEGTIQAFSPATGAPVWSKRMPGVGALNQLVVTGGLLAAAGSSDAGGLVVTVRKLGNGAGVWTRTINNCGPGQVMVVEQVAISPGCTATSGKVIGRNLTTGAVLWSRTGNWALLRGDSDTTAGRHLFAVNPSGTVVSLDPLTGKTQDSLAGAANVLAVDGSQAYGACGGSGNLQVCAYDSATGSLRWQVQPGLFSEPALAAEADGVLYLDQGFALDTSTGNTLAALWDPGLSLATELVVGDGRVAAVADPRVVALYGLPGS